MAEGLERFVTAQDAVWAQVVREMRAGAKQSHWMWFVFPQIAGLGRSATSVKFALSGVEEAKAYLAHGVLGPRLREVTELALAYRDVPVQAVFGGIDALKLQASMTLFEAAAPEEALFPAVLDAFFDGARHRRTLELLRG